MLMSGKMKTNTMKLAFALHVLLGIFALSGCGRDDSATSSPYLDGLTISLTEKPTSSGSSTHEYSATIVDRSGQSALLDRVHLALEMTMRGGMHHETEGDMVKTGEGTYTVKLKWAMAGDWKAAVTIEKDRHEKTIRSIEPK